MNDQPIPELPDVDLRKMLAYAEHAPTRVERFAALPDELQRSLLHIVDIAAGMSQSEKEATCRASLSIHAQADDPRQPYGLIHQSLANAVWVVRELAEGRTHEQISRILRGEPADDVEEVVGDPDA